MATVLLGSESSVAAKTAASNAVSTSMLLPLAGPKRCEAEGHPLLQRSPEHHFAPHTIQAHTWRQVRVG